MIGETRKRERGRERERQIERKRCRQMETCVWGEG